MWAFEIQKHIRYFRAMLATLPAPYASLDTNRITVAYFCVSGLDILGAIDQVDREQVIKWVYALQVCGPTARSRAPSTRAGFGRGAQ